MKDLIDEKILVVDDTEANIDILVEALGEDYDICVAMDGESALQTVNDDPPSLILLDIMMPGIDGYEVCRRLKKDPKTEEIPIIFITAMSELENKTKGFELGSVDYITKPFEVMEVKARVKTHLSLMHTKKQLANQNEILEIRVKERTKELSLTQDATIFSLATLAEYRDPETGAHIRRTQNYVKALCERLKTYPKYKEFLSTTTIDLLYKSAPLHDIGKVGVPDSILLKPGKLTNDEYEEMKLHTVYGRDTILAAEKILGTKSTFMTFAREIAYTHQEKWDGSGYPEGKKDEEIPFSGRLMAVADVYDALTSERVYKTRFSHEKAVHIIVEGKSKHFDPDIVEAFVEITEEFEKIASAYLDSNE
jgi:putative two-component system response regulator